MLVSAPEGDDPAMVHHNIEAEQRLVESAGRFGFVGLQIGYNSKHCHVLISPFAGT